LATKLALVGKARVGRSAVAAYLKNAHGFKNMGLQDGTRRILRTLYGWQTYHRVSWQQYTQVYDALYKIDSNIWITFLVDRLKRTTMEDIVVDDVRYINELEILKNLGFKIVRVTAPEIRVRHLTANLFDAAPGSLLVQEWYNKDFTEQVGVDYSIHNGTKEQMRRAIDSLVINLAQI
jgi:hypothetical protein